jgi:hypothetical protein
MEFTWKLKENEGINWFLGTKHYNDPEFLNFEGFAIKRADPVVLDK